LTREGVLFHAKHAYMPNTLGYCGPDEKGVIQDGLEEGKPGDGMVRALQRFEAAYPFLRLIARNTGREVFDYAVPEAYWIGNSLLDRVPPPDFYSFSHRELQGKDQVKVRDLFKGLDGMAKPHHSFYVMSTYASSSELDGPNVENDSERKLGTLIDNCRISWGTVQAVGGGELKVRSRPVELSGGRLALGEPRFRSVRYNRAVKPFGSVKKGDVVSLHWGYACDVLNGEQAVNIARYTRWDISRINRYLASRR